MLARLATAALVGLTAYPVGVEVDIGRGLPAVTVVGLGGTAVLEARDRLRAAFGNTGYEWPDRRITVSLPPADLPKQGSGFDLPIAIGLLAAAGWVPPTALEGLWAIGELGLGGDVRAVKGVLPAALAARRSSARLLVVPQANLVEAALVPGLPVAGAASLEQVGEWLVGRADLGRPGPPPDPQVPVVEDLADIRGQHQARRALEIAAAGAHNLLLTGPPGAGKTMLARRLPGLLPPLEQDEALEVTQVLSAAGLLGPDAGLIRIRPFRAPHHAISVPGLVGGGQVPRPGEVSLAHARVNQCHLSTQAFAVLLEHIFKAFTPPTIKTLSCSNPCNPAQRHSWTTPLTSTFLYSPFVLSSSQFQSFYTSASAMHGCRRLAAGRSGRVALPVKALKAGQESYWLDQIARNREEYFSGRGESPGRFVGSAAAAAGLDGIAGPEQVRAMFQGLDPATGELRCAPLLGPTRAPSWPPGRCWRPSRPAPTEPGCGGPGGAGRVQGAPG